MESHQMRLFENVRAQSGTGIDDDGTQSLNPLPSLSESAQEHRKFDNVNGNTSLGKPRKKRRVDQLDITAVTVSLLCLVATSVIVAPSLSIPYQLGLKRQLQVVGFLLSVMNLCLQAVTPKLFVRIEARFGPSTLQNYDAILRQKGTLSDMNLSWRILLLALVALPLALSFAYKDFQQGYGRQHIPTDGHMYGLTGPAGLQLGELMSTGVSLMVNATLPFVTTSNNETTPNLHLVPLPFGFNMLLLSNTSTAYLDAPMPDFISSLQRTMAIGDSYTLAATVHATVTTYNTSIESNRNDPTFWKYYYDQMGSPVDRGDTNSSIQVGNMFDGWRLGLMVNTQEYLNASWCFLGFVNASTDSNPDKRNDAFHAGSLLFNTRRELCNGVWRITYNSILLSGGNCDAGPPADVNQTIFTDNDLALTDFYMPSLIEYLGAFGTKQKQSQWLVPTFTSVVAGMYWSRITALDGPSFIGNGSPQFNGLKTVPPSEVYYNASDTLVSMKQTMDTSWALYFVFCLQPFLTVSFFLACLCMYSSPIDGGFGMIAILAGVRTKSLEIIQGASISGRLKKPLPVKILVGEPVTTGDQAVAQNEYVLGEDGKADRSLRSPLQRIWQQGVLRKRVPKVKPTGPHSRRETHYDKL